MFIAENSGYRGSESLGCTKPPRSFCVSVGISRGVRATERSVTPGLNTRALPGPRAAWRPQAHLPQGNGGGAERTRESGRLPLAGAAARAAETGRARGGGRAMQCVQDEEISLRRWHLNTDLGVSEQAGLGACEGSESGGGRPRQKQRGARGEQEVGGGQAGAPAAAPADTGCLGWV